MNLKLLIDGIVRQTTVLIAQLSTASGARSPLSHVTDEVFVSLAREIEAQGVRKQVVADMFGMAMRSYQKKMARLTESASQRERSLWEAVFDFVAEHSPTHARYWSASPTTASVKSLRYSTIWYAAASSFPRAAVTRRSSVLPAARCAAACNTSTIRSR